MKNKIKLLPYCLEDEMFNKKTLQFFVFYLFLLSLAFPLTCLITNVNIINSIIGGIIGFIILSAILIILNTIIDGLEFITRKD